MAARIALADLTHTGQLVAANSFPLGLAYIAAYAREHIDAEIEVFKYPGDFAAYCDKAAPDIAGFSCFVWNVRLHHEYARRLKAKSPGTITVFGGPHFPDTPEEQERFLKQFPAIDFYIEMEGERAFVEFYTAMNQHGFDAAWYKATAQTTPSLRYLREGKLVRGAMIEKVRDLSLLPSPHLSGVCDKFYDGVLIPMMQTTRGCPYTCTFCWEGGPFFSKVGRFPQPRVREELAYIAARVGTVPDLFLIDSNFGIFEQDIDTSRAILEMQAAHGWPKSVMTSTAKNHKERTMRIADLLGVTLPVTAAVQSTAPEVLGEISRKNVGLDVLTKMAANSARHGAQTEAEIILCLPGDTLEAHTKSVYDMLDAGMTYIRMYQTMMLLGTEMVSPASRAKHAMTTRYRVLPRCFGVYGFGDEQFPCAEIEEICTSNATMPPEDYQACRDLNLTVEIFSNDGIFADLTAFLEGFGIKRSDFVKAVVGLVPGNAVLRKLYADYRAEEAKNLWNNAADLERFTNEPGVMERYISGEYGTNELYKYRALAVFEHIYELHRVAYDAARELLTYQMPPGAEDYLNQMAAVSLLRKSQPLATNMEHSVETTYDFTAADPLHHPGAFRLDIRHTPEQCALIAGYVRQYGTTLIGLGRILVRANMARLHRTAVRV